MVGWLVEEKSGIGRRKKIVETRHPSSSRGKQSVSIHLEVAKG
jgi:hypothetical protein